MAVAFAIAMAKRLRVKETKSLRVIATNKPLEALGDSKGVHIEGKKMS